MLYYIQCDRVCHTRASSSLNRQANPTSTVPINSFKSISCILCRLTGCFFLLISGIVLFYKSIINGPFQSDGLSFIAFVFLAIATISCMRSCLTLSQYLMRINTRRQLIQRSDEEGQVSNLALSSNNNENPELVTNGVTDLPSYKELFPSQLGSSNNGENLLSNLLPPSYDDFLKRPVIYHPTTTLPISSLRSPALSMPTTPLSSISLSPCIWITDQTQRPFCIRGTVTYV